MLKKLFKFFSRGKHRSEEKKMDTQFGIPESIPDETMIEDTKSIGFYQDGQEKTDEYFELDILVNGAKISSHHLNKGQVKLGRDPSQADIIIAEPIISKLHCTITKKDNQIFITDNNSTNGIYINSIKTIEHTLNDKDIVSLGRKGTVKLVIYKVIK